MPLDRRVRSAILTILITAAMLMFAVGVRAESASKSPDYKELQLFYKVMKIVQKNYVKDVPDKELLQGAINGMLQSLDPHSSFLTEDMFKELQVETKGEFGGLGIEITLENGVLTIVSPIEDTPAFKAGLKPGDKIIKIDGETTKNITLLKAVKMMRGPRGSKVNITIMREGFNKLKDYTLTRDIIHVHSVKKQLITPGYAYIKVVNFQESTDTDLTSAIQELGDDASIKGVILDLRNNPGGLLDQAVKVTNMFIDKGLIVYTDGRAKDQRMEFRANTTGQHYKFKMATLINEGSASASEIVAGALQDHDRSLILGSKSFGKASVQTIIPLDNGSGLRLTTAYYYTPKGRHIQKTGILPDVDMKEEMQKQEESEADDDKKGKQKKQVYPKPVVDLENDQVVKKALEWLKSDVTVKQFKMDNQKKNLPDTALNQD
ncbi:MAG TPA: S41 family peptidase [Desulfomonilaceae bacterium]|nr:S41 family peptidase [Desulfomonilaceae bacterium]